VVNEPGLIPVLANVLKQYADKDYPVDGEKLRESLSVVCTHHSRLRQGFEVSWSLWLSKLFSIELPPGVLKEVALVEDSVVALIALDLRRNGLAPGLETSTWEKSMSGEELYRENWLLAYEALVHGWLTAKGGADYVRDDPLFGLLQQKGVEFYNAGVSTAVPAGVWFAAY
jgi:hypothetical protein